MPGQGEAPSVVSVTEDGVARPSRISSSGSRKSWTPWSEYALYPTQPSETVGPNTQRKYYLAGLYCLLYLLPSFGSFMFAVQEHAVVDLYNTSTEQISSCVSYFLFANSMATFLEPWLISRFGMRRTLVLASSLNFAGCFMRSGFGWVLPYRTASWDTVVYGTVLLGFSQGIVQCPIAKFAATWFPTHQQTEVTAFIMAFDNVGVGLSFIAPGLIWDQMEGVAKLLFTLTCLSSVTWVGVLVFMESEPPCTSGATRITRGETSTVPLSSDTATSREVEEDEKRFASEQVELRDPTLVEFWTEGFGLVRQGGFFQLGAAFVFSATIQNAFSSYFSVTLTEDLSANDYVTGTTGFSFWTLNAGMALIVGPFVDRLKVTDPWGAYIGTTHFFSISTMMASGGMLLALSNGGIHSRAWFAFNTVLAGNLVSMVQPLANDAGLAVISHRERSREYKIDDENLVLTLLQLSANTLSSVFVDICANFEDVMVPQYIFVYIATLSVSFGLYLVFATFKGNLEVSKSNRAGYVYGEYIRNDGTTETGYHDPRTQPSTAGQTANSSDAETGTLLTPSAPPAN